MVQILKNRSFSSIWLASLLSTLGSQVSRIGLMLYLIDTGGAIVNLALLVVFDTLPGAIAAPLSGAVVDRLNKRMVMVFADLARMLLMLFILLRPSPAIIYLAAALHSIATVFFQPAKSAAIPLIVKPEDLAKANAAEQSGTNLILIVGPVIGAVLFKQFGLTLSLLLDGLSFLASAALIARVRIRTVERKPIKVSALGAVNEIKEGCQYLVSNRLALHLNVLLFVALVCTGLWIPLAPFFIREYLGVSEQLLGWQLGLFGIGAVIGGLIAPRLVDRFGTGITLFTAFLGEALALICYGLVSHPGISMLIVLVWGGVLSIIVVPFYTILQRSVEEQFLGRVFAINKQVENLAIVLAMASAIVLEQLVAAPLIFLFAGLGYLGFTALSSLSRGGRALLATR